MDQNLEGFIDDNEEEDEGSGGEASSGPEGEKRKREESDIDEDLEDDDYDLLEENLGIKVKRKVRDTSWWPVFFFLQSWLLGEVQYYNVKVKFYEYEKVEGSEVRLCEFCNLF